MCNENNVLYTKEVPSYKNGMYSEIVGYAIRKFVQTTQNNRDLFSTLRKYRQFFSKIDQHADILEFVQQRGSCSFETLETPTLPSENITRSILNQFVELGIFKMRLLDPDELPKRPCGRIDKIKMYFIDDSSCTETMQYYAKKYRGEIEKIKLDIEVWQEMMEFEPDDRLLYLDKIKKSQKKLKWLEI